MHGRRVRRRDFMAAFGCAVLSPLASSAHQTAKQIVGFVDSASPGGYPPLSAFLKGLGEVGFVEGRNVVIEYRWAQGRYERLPALVDDLVHRKVSVIAATSTAAVLAARGGKRSNTYRLHDKQRSSLLDRLKQQHPELPIVMMSGYGNIENAAPTTLSRSLLKPTA
jgi:hypothetical protein